VKKPERTRLAEVREKQLGLGRIAGEFRVEASVRSAFANQAADEIEIRRACGVRHALPQQGMPTA
jgi:hypothetical protein